MSVKQRIKVFIRFTVDRRKKAILLVNLRWQGKAVDLSLSKYLQWLYQHENDMTPEDSEFCYSLAKFVKKVFIGHRAVFAVPSETDIGLFFKRVFTHKIKVFEEFKSKKIPVKFNDSIPFNLSVSKRKGALVCRWENKSKVFANSVKWIRIRFLRESMWFYRGKVLFNPSSQLERFLKQFQNKQELVYRDEDVIKFMNDIYSPNKKILDWRVQEDLLGLMPRKRVPDPVLTLNYENQCLSMVVSFQYASEVIPPDFTGDLVKEKRTGYLYHRLPEHEEKRKKELMQYITDHHLPFMLTNPGEIAVFMNEIAPNLAKNDWVINSNVPEFEVHKDPVKLDFVVQSHMAEGARNGGGQNWFYFEPNCEVGGQSFSLQEISRVIVQNQGYLKTKSGYIKVADSSREELKLLAQFGAFKVDKKFNMAEILPLISFSEVKGGDQATQSFVQKAKGLQEGETLSLGKGFKGELRDYQQQGVHWLSFLYQSGLGGILADDMGLGKTIQALAFASQLDDVKTPILVVGPTNVVFNWKKEIEKFLPNKKTLVYTGGNRMKKLTEFKSVDFIVTSYGVLKNDVEIFSNIFFKSIFIDEAQYIKNPSAQISKAVKKLQGRFKLVMTGTPIENHLLDLWNLFDWAMPSYLGTKSQFDVDIKNEKKFVIKARIKPFVLRREKREVLDSLPEKTEVVVNCPLTESQSKLYQAVLDAAKKGIRTSTGKHERLNILTSLLKLRQVCIHPGLLQEFQGQFVESGKFSIIKERCTELMEENHKVVIFSQFRAMLDLIQEWVQEQGFYFRRIDGQVTGKKRMDVINEFQDYEGAGVFLISLKAGGVGINLTAADYVFHVDPWWNPAIESQATDRVHRMGQKNKVMVYRFISEGTIEEKIQALQEEKKQLIHDMIDVDSLEGKQLNMEEIKSLLLES